MRRHGSFTWLALTPLVMAAVQAAVVPSAPPAPAGDDAAITMVSVDTRSAGSGRHAGFLVEVQATGRMRRVDSRPRTPREEFAELRSADVRSLFDFIGRSGALGARGTREIGPGYDMPSALVVVHYADGTESRIVNTVFGVDPGPLDFWATVRIVEGLAAGASWGRSDDGSGGVTERSRPMAKVTGIGGVFLKSKGEGAALAAWYREHLGMTLEDFGGVILRWPDDKADDGGLTVWHVADGDSKWFSPSRSSFMINYRVDDLVALLEQLRAAGVEVVQGPESHENGKFAWIMDPDGNKVELWQPMAWDEKNKER